MEEDNRAILKKSLQLLQLAEKDTPKEIEERNSVSRFEICYFNEEKPSNSKTQRNTSC